MADSLKVKAEDFPRLSNVVRWWERVHGKLDDLLYTSPRRTARNNQERIYLYNASGEEIPPFACMEVAGRSIIHNRLFYAVGKPSTTFRQQYLPNGPRAIPWVSTSVPSFGSIVDRPYALWSYTGGPSIDAGFGPVPGSWSLGENYPAVTEVTGTLEDSTAFWGTVHPIMAVVIKNLTGSDIASNSSGAFTIMKGAAGAEASAGFNTVSMYNRTSQPFANGAIGSGVRLNGNWYALPWEC